MLKNRLIKFSILISLVLLNFSMAPKVYVLGATLNETSQVHPSLNYEIARLEESAVMKPADGITKDQPFAVGTAGSEYFRIPVFTVMQDGTYVCAADARWDHTRDGGGSDIIFSISKDEGKTWTYSFPFYFGDSANSKIPFSEVATFIDPELITKGNTIWLFTNAYPAGVMSEQKFPAVGTGYINVGGIMRLALTDNYENADKNPKESDISVYPYYVGDFDNGYAPILKRLGGATAYWVDEVYHIYKKTPDGFVKLEQKQVNSDVIIGQNCFFRDSMFHVYNTTYLFMARSDDKGKTWTYKVLNPQVKSDGDAQLVTSPGNGLVLRDGTLVASVWERPDEFENPDGWIASNNDRSGFIYSKDDGVTWERMEGIGVYSNENHIVELNDISLRMFYRYDAEGGKISYVDAKSDGAGYTWWENCQSELEADVACNLSVLSYSKTVGGRQVILISCPATYSRKNGTIYLCQVEDDMSLSLLSKYMVTEDIFAYSAMDELKDGSIGILYETGIGAGNLVFEKIGIEAIAGGIKFDDTPDASETQRPIVSVSKKGDVLKYGKHRYKVTKARSTVSFFGTESSAKNIVIPATVKIGNIRYKVTSIAANAFRNNRKLKKVTLGAEIQKIGRMAFKGCRKLGTVNIKSKKLKKIGKNALKGIKPNAKINVFSNKLNAYKALFSGKGLGNKVQWNRK